MGWVQGTSGDTGLGHGADNDYDDDDADDDEDDNDDYYCRVVLSDANCAVLSDPNPVVPSDPTTIVCTGQTNSQERQTTKDATIRTVDLPRQSQAKPIMRSLSHLGMDK